MQTYAEESMVSVAQRLAADVRPRADSADRTATLPAEDVEALITSGYSTLAVPKEYGGYGATLAEAVEAQLELAQGSGSTAMVAAMQTQVFGNEREQRTWSEAHFAYACEQAVNYGGLFNSCASEPRLGSPSRGRVFATTAIRDGDEFVINGHKNWITGGQYLTHLMTWLDINGEANMVMIPGDAQGIRWEETWQAAFSLRATNSHDVIFEDVRVPVTNLFKSPNSKKTRPNAWFPMMLSGVYLGSALAARNTLIEYTLERVPSSLGKPIATLPKIQRQVGALDVKLQAARRFLLDACKEWNGGQDWQAAYPNLVAAKYFAINAANEATQDAMEIAGAASISGYQLPLERYFRDVRAGLMQPPAGETALEIIGKAAIGPIEDVQQSAE